MSLGSDDMKDRERERDRLSSHIIWTGESHRQTLPYVHWCTTHDNGKVHSTNQGKVFEKMEEACRRKSNQNDGSAWLMAGKL